MKKLVSILLTLIMIMGLCTTAFAAEDTSITFTDSNARTYNGYQLLGLSISLKGDGHHVAHDGEHMDSCYNYAYTVNVKYRAILQKETLDNGRNELWGEEKPTDPSKVTDDQILQYLSFQSSDNGDVSGTMRQVADRIYRDIMKDGTIEPDKVNMNGQNTIGLGYWLFADVTGMEGKDDANSLVMVDTKGESAITINPKVSIPTIEKKVKDIEDSEDGTIGDNAWHDSADHDMGDDKIPFKVTVTLPSNYTAYHQEVKQVDDSYKDTQIYKMIIHDTMSEGLTLQTQNDTFKVLMYESKYKAEVDTDLNDSMKEVTDHFTLKTTGLEDKTCTFEVVCDNIFAIEGLTKDTTFVVYYEAKLNENAVIGAKGNPNTVYLEYSNDPYGTTTGKTEEDTVTVFTYQVIINKTDSHGHKLTGAGFELYKKNVAGKYELLGTEQKGDTMTTFTWVGLDDGDYKLVESTVPAGFNKMSDILFSISAAHSETADEPELVSLDGGQLGTGVVNTGAITKDVVNNTGTILPETGARGTLLLIGGSSMVVMMAAIFMVTRKKMSIYED